MVTDAIKYLMRLFSLQVNKWLVGIKRLIQEVRLTDAPMSPSSSALSQPTEVSCMAQAETPQESSPTVNTDSRSPLLENGHSRTFTTVSAVKSGIACPDLTDELQRCHVANSVSEPHTELFGDASCTAESVTLISNTASPLLIVESTVEKTPVVLVPPVSELLLIADVPLSEIGTSVLAGESDRLDIVAQKETLLPNETALQDARLVPSCEPNGMDDRAGERVHSVNSSLTSSVGEAQWTCRSCNAALLFHVSRCFDRFRFLFSYLKEFELHHCRWLVDLVSCVRIYSNQDD